MASGPCFASYFLRFPQCCLAGPGVNDVRADCGIVNQITVVTASVIIRIGECLAGFDGIKTAAAAVYSLYCWTTDKIKQRNNKAEIENKVAFCNR